MDLVELLFDKHPHPIIIHDAVTNDILEVNESAVEKYGYSRPEFTGLTIDDLQADEASDGVEYEWMTPEREPLVKGEAVTQHKTKDHSLLLVNLTRQKFDWQGYDACISSIRVINKLKRAQYQLQRKNDHLLKMQSLARMGWWELEMGTYDLEWSDNLYEILNLDKETVNGEVDIFRSYVHPEDAYILDMVLKHAKRTQTPIDYQLRMQVPDSETLYLRCRAQGEWDKDGTLNRITGIAQNITANVQVQQDKEEAEVRYREQRAFSDKLIDNLPDLFLLVDSNGKVVRWNKQFERTSGYSPDVIEGHSATAFFLDTEQEKLEKTLREVLAGHDTGSEGTLVTANGEKIPHMLQGIKFNFNNEEYVAGVGTNISELKQVQQHLEKSREGLKRAQKIAQIGSFEWDIPNDAIRYSDEAYDIYGFEVEGEEMPGLDKYMDIVHPNDRLHVKRNVERILEGKGFVSFEHRIRTSDGTEKYLIQRGDVDYDEQGNPLMVVGTVQDFTHQKEREREKEVLLAEIHHRVKNNLAIISGLLELEAMKWDDNEDVQHVMDQSKLRIQSMAMIHEKLYKAGSFASLRLGTYVTDLVKTIYNTMGGTAKKVKLNIDTDDLMLNINQAIPCGMILNELVTNAFKYAFEGDGRGILSIKFLEDEGDVVIVVKDNGPGLPRDFNEMVAHSLGHRIIYQLVKQLGGTIDVQSDQDRGTEYSIRFGKEQKPGSSASGRVSDAY